MDVRHSKLIIMAIGRLLIVNEINNISQGFQTNLGTTSAEQCSFSPDAVPKVV